MSNDEARKRTYGVELFFDAPYDLRDPRLGRALVEACPRAEVEVRQGGVVAYHRDLVRADEPTTVPQTVVLGTLAPVDADVLEPVIAQSRAWPRELARAAVERARHRLLVTDLLADAIPAPIRLEVFQRALLGVVRALAPVAISWVPAGKLVEPKAFVAAMEKDEAEERALAALNVRLFPIADGDGACVMDSLGLAPFGLTDLEIHFRGLEPNAVARRLFSTALYVLERGEVLADGHTADGVEPGQKWAVRRKRAIVGPARDVFAFDPGPPFACDPEP